MQAHRNEIRPVAAGGHKRFASRGQSTLEGALILLLFLAVLTGILDLAQVVFAHQLITERTREAARFAAVNPWNATNVTRTQNVVLYGRADPTDSTSAPWYPLERSMVSVQRPTPDYSSEDRVVVTVSGFPFESFSFFIAGLKCGKPIVASLPFEVVN